MTLTVYNQIFVVGGKPLAVDYDAHNKRDISSTKHDMRR